MDGGDHRTSLRIETKRCVCVSDRGDGAAHNRREIYIRLGGDFAGDECQPSSQECFASYAAVTIFFKTRIENGVGNLIGDFVRMPFSHRL